MLSACQAFKIADAHQIVAARVAREINKIAPLVEKNADAGYFDFHHVFEAEIPYFRDLIEIRFRCMVVHELQKLGYQIIGDPALAPTLTISWRIK